MRDMSTDEPGAAKAARDASLHTPEQLDWRDVSCHHNQPFDHRSRCRDCEKEGL